MTDTPEWMTVAEAARRLGLSDRHARRLVDRLDEADRLKQGTSPLRVRLAALGQLWEREGPDSDSQTPGKPESDAESDSRVEVEDAVSRARLEERLEAAEGLIGELRQDKRQLQETLTREQENHLRLLDQLAEERQELRLLQARIIQALPAGPDRESDSIVLRHPTPEPQPLPDEEPQPAAPPMPPPGAVVDAPVPRQSRRRAFGNGWPAGSATRLPPSHGRTTTSAIARW